MKNKTLMALPLLFVSVLIRPALVVIQYSLRPLLFISSTHLALADDGDGGNGSDGGGGGDGGNAGDGSNGNGGNGGEGSDVEAMGVMGVMVMARVMGAWW